MSLDQTSERFKEVSSSKELLEIFGNDLGDQSSILESMSHRFAKTASIASQLNNFRSKRLRYQSNEDGETNTSDELESVIVDILDSLSSLSIGDFAILPGGWAQRNGGHAILFVVQREENATLGTISIGSQSESNLSMQLQILGLCRSLIKDVIHLLWSTRAKELTIMPTGISIWMAIQRRWFELASP